MNRMEGDPDLMIYGPSSPPQPLSSSSLTPDVAVVIPLNNPVGPADDTVTAE